MKDIDEQAFLERPVPQIDCVIEDSVFYELGDQDKADNDNRNELCQYEMDLMMKNVNNPDIKVMNNDGVEQEPANGENQV